MKYLKYLYNTLRIVLGVVFLYASIHKIMYPYETLGNIYDYQILNPTAGLMLSICLPWLEAVVGICLICGAFARGSLLIINILCIVFLISEASVVMRGLKVGCGCFGSLQDEVNVFTMARTSLILIAAMLLIWADYYIEKNHPKAIQAGQSLR